MHKIELTTSIMANENTNSDSASDIEHDTPGIMPNSLTKVVAYELQRYQSGEGEYWCGHVTYKFTFSKKEAIEWVKKDKKELWIRRNKSIRRTLYVDENQRYYCANLKTLEHKIEGVSEHKIEPEKQKRKISVEILAPPSK